MRIRSAAATVIVVLAGCTQNAPPSGRDARNEVSVERSGSAARAGRIGAAALLRVAGTQPRGPIDLELSFLSHDGEEVASTRDSLPFCPADRDCWWAASFFADDYGGSKIARVRVKVGAAEPFGGGDDVRPFAVRRGDDGVIRGEAPGEQGAAFVVASVGSQPRWGSSVNLTGSTMVAVPGDLLPTLDGEQLRGYFYPGRAVAGD